MAVEADDPSTAPSMDQPEPPTPLARYTGCPFNALICRECGVSIGKRDSKLTLRQLVKNHERSKHKDNQHKDNPAAPSVVTALCRCCCRSLSGSRSLCIRSVVRLCLLLYVNRSADDDDFVEPINAFGEVDRLLSQRPSHTALSPSRRLEDFRFLSPRHRRILTAASSRLKYGRYDNEGFHDTAQLDDQGPPKRFGNGRGQCGIDSGRSV
jgi:hypothetical protein